MIKLPQAKEAALSLQVAGPDGQAITDYDVEHTKRMHLIVVRRDLTGFQHLHPTMSENGTGLNPWNAPRRGVVQGVLRRLHPRRQCPNPGFRPCS